MSNDRTPDNPYDEHGFKTLTPSPEQTNWFDPVSGTYIHVNFKYDSMLEQPQTEAPSESKPASLFSRFKSIYKRKPTEPEPVKVSPRHQRNTPTVGTPRNTVASSKKFRR